MAIKIGSNIASLQAQRHLGEATSSLSNIYERLSSGQRINHASDDAAGLAILTSLNSSARIFSVALRNINDAVSATNISEGALKAVEDISIRQRELAEQAANGTYSTKQRQALTTEANALVDEFNRIAGSTKFNGMSLLDANLGSVIIQAGTGTENTLTLGFSDQLSRNIGDGTFGTQQNVAVGSNPFATALGDLNGDSILDLAWAGTGTGTIGYKLGVGDGTFGSSQTLATGGGPLDILIVDVNGDRNLDIVSSNTGVDSVYVYLGNGKGAFGAGQASSVGVAPYGLTSGDYNGDGKLDVATSDGTSGTVSVLIGNGNGTFASRKSYSVSALPRDVKSGDFNGDGILDIISASQGASSTDVLLGIGDGTFRAAISTAVGSSIHSVALGDVNGDGLLDFVGADYGSFTVGVYIGRGNGTFNAQVSYSTPGLAWDVALADLNGDGRSDLIAAERYHGLSVRIGNGDGTFGSRTAYAAGADVFFVTAGDVNGDGRIDLVNSQSYSGSNLGIRLGNGGVTSNISYLNLNSRQGALDAMSTIDANILRIQKQIGSIGATTSRLQVAANVILTQKENFLAAASRITDVDVAEQSAALVRTQILQQAATSVLAQANQQPQIALSLLRT